MKQYLDLVKHIRETGVFKGDRTGTGTQSIFGYQTRFNLQEGFPIVTTKFTSFRLVVSELLWFLRGETNIASLLEDNNHIWDEWATPDGELGPVYGHQWRSWGSSERIVDENLDTVEYGREGIDQIEELITGLKKKPFSRRHIVSAWNVTDLPDESISPQANAANGKMALAPCHALFQFIVEPMSIEERRALVKEEDLHSDDPSAPWSIDRDALTEDSLEQLAIPVNKLSCLLYQRSCDTFLGVPFNIASYALLTHMVAQVVDMAPGEFIWTGGDVHLYNNHKEQVDELLSREPLPLPELWLNPDVRSLDDFTMDDIKLIGYEHQGSIKAPVAV